MKTTALHRKRGSRAYALLLVLSMAACSMMLLTATMWRTATDTDITARNNQYNAGICAAEAATEKVLSRMRYDYMAGQSGLIASNLNIYRGYVPTAAENPYWANFQFSDGEGNLDRTYVAAISGTTYQPLGYSGLSGWTTTYRILSNVSQTTRANFSLTNALQQDVQLESIPIFQFAIFYNSLLEFTWACTLTVNGRVHANGNIFWGSLDNLTLNTTATSSGVIIETNWASHTTSQFTGGIFTNGSPGYITNVPVMQLPIGTNNTPAAVQQIIMPPPAGEDPNSPMGLQRYYNKAEVVIIVNNSSVDAIVQDPVDHTTYTNLMVNYNSTNYTAVSNNFPFLTVTNYFADQREGKIVKVSQVDVGQLSNWLLRNPTVTNYYPPVGSGPYPNILYIEDNRTDAGTANGTEMMAVRLIDGSSIPTNGGTGFTIATPDPLYVLGNYNAPTAANQASTNVAGTQPASLISDALTVLSSSWRDGASSNSFNPNGGVRPASSTDTIDAALIAGVVYSSGAGDMGPPSHFSGGVVNYPRLLEDWSSSSLWLNTSIVNMYPSMVATNQWQQPGVYYLAPTRDFSFNTSYLNVNKQPPGTPCLDLIQKAKWTIPPPGTVTYNGY